MVQKNRTVLIVAIVVGLVALFAGAFFLLYKPEPKGLKVGISTLPDSLNPVLAQNNVGLNADELVFDGLVNFEIDQASGSLISEFALAESITQDPATKKTYQVALKDVAWHDGRKLSAADVEFSFAAYMEPKNESPKRAYLESFIESVKAVDEQNLVIEFRKPLPEFRAYPVLSFKIIPSEYKGKKLAADLRAGELERQFAVSPVGTGPFVLDSWEIGKWVSFKANPTYFRRKPAAESLVLQNIIDPVIRMNEFQQKRINLILETSPADRAAVEKMGSVDINSFLPFSFYQVAINAKAPAFRAAAARAALAAAVDPASVVPGITDKKELALVNFGPFPSNLFARNFADYDVEPLRDPWVEGEAAVKAAVADAGLAGKTFALMFPDSMGEFGQSVAEGIAAQLGKAGITVEVKRTGDQVFKRLVQGEKSYDLALQYCDGFDNLYSDLTKYYKSKGSLNIYGLADPELDALLDKWDATVVTADWIEITRELHERICAAAPAIPLFSLEKDVYSRGISNIKIASDNPFLSAEDWSQGGK
ncbi:MAG TPA: ABC transporter substrate-binding protein [Spirochaetales bacterium]|nr:ABC transporter substrate-binding protein [Spirochaetales bacterium]HRY55193.1 ABC transporter substrate-binding protein [Spirochaetia bacterium]HRZ64595.1 ABC transporter substrate-binding protein [Spirochaetia bacterium]